MMWAFVPPAAGCVRSPIGAAPPSSGAAAPTLIRPSPAIRRSRYSRAAGTSSVRRRRRRGGGRAPGDGRRPPGSSHPGNRAALLRRRGCCLSLVCTSAGHRTTARSLVAQPRPLERAKLLFFRYFEQTFVLLLVLAMVAIHYLVEQKFAFLSFYYLPMILAGFYGGPRFAVMAGVVVVGLVVYWQAVPGLDVLRGRSGAAFSAFAPWAGFLILTG